MASAVVGSTALANTLTSNLLLSNVSMYNSPGTDMGRGPAGDSTSGAIGLV